MDAAVFIHHGWATYVCTALRQAIARADAPVYLITDTPRYDNIPGLHTVRSADLDGAQAFVHVYRHLSGNPQAFELFCWRRWFLLRSLAERERLDRVVHLDSDALLFAPIARLASALSGNANQAALCISSEAEASWLEPVMGSASGHCSVWTPAGLDGFCSFARQAFEPGPLLDRFQAKWTHHQRAGLTGGVCDMTGLMAFALSRPDAVVNLLIPTPHGVVDDNMNRGDNRCRNEFRTRLGLKRVRLRRGLPHLIEVATQREIPALTLHFQGNAKRMMSWYASDHSLTPAVQAGWRAALSLRSGLRVLKRACRAS